MSPLRLETTLANGAELLAIHTPGLKSGVIAAHVRVGSRFEQSENAGISHFLEHMLCRGTARHPSAHEQALAFESVAGTLSAATLVDHGTLSVALPADTFDPVAPLFAETFEAPLLTDIELERGIIEEEILEGLDESGKSIDGDNLVRELCFEDHPLGFPITGTLDHVRRFEPAILRAHHARHYTGACSVISVAGPFDPEHVLATLTRCFEGLGSGAAPSFRAPPEQTAPRFRYVRNPGSQTTLRIAFRAPGRGAKLEPATELLLRTLDDGMSTRLYHQICDIRGLCYDISAAYEAYADVGLFDIQTDTLHERAGQVLEETFNVLRDLRSHGPSDAELAKAKRRASWEFSAIWDDAAELADFCGTARLLGMTSTPEARREELLAVSVDDVRQAATSVFRRDSLSVVAVGVLPRRAQHALARLVETFG
ncbi:MAG TPA: pitrilysin family protein [Polyangiaceae bacterium]|nr:pitrilysin family protein [Polyangiaceae bacterium]